MRIRRCRVSVLAAAAVALALATLLPAGAATTGQLTGLVADPNGSPLPGVTVISSSPVQIGGEQRTHTDEAGRFTFPRLAPGEFTVELHRDGFGRVELSEVQVRLDRVTEVRVELPLLEHAEEVTVIALQPVVDPAQVSVGQTFTREYLAETAPRFAELVSQVAGTSPTNFRRVLGGTPQDNTYLLDGQDATHWFQRFPAPPAFSMPFDVVQEAAVHSAGFEAEYGQATGSVVNVVTRSGGNRFSGTVDVRYTESSLASSGEHYDPDSEPAEGHDGSLTLGGPVVRDKLWFFTALVDRRDEFVVSDSPVSTIREERYHLAKASGQAGPGWQLSAKYIGTPHTVDAPNASATVAAEANRFQDDDPTLLSLDAAGTLSSSLLLELRGSRHRWPETVLPLSGDLTTINHLNLVTRESYGNYLFQSYLDSDQDQLEADLSWLTSSGRGSHEIKAGLRYGHPSIDDDTCATGGGRCAPGVEGFQFVDVIGADGGPVPFGFYVQEARGAITYDADYEAAYLQDTWRPLPDLTLKLGLRLDRIDYGNDLGEVAGLEKLQPRLGAAWDLTGDGKTLARVSWGRYMHPGNLIAGLEASPSNSLELWLSCSANGIPDAERCALVAGRLGLSYRTDPESWDPAGWVLPPGNVFLSEPARVAEGLRTPYAEEWVAGVERQILPRTSVELSWVSKHHSQLYDDTCNGNQPEPTEGAACDFHVIANLPEARLGYQGLVLRFESRYLERLHLLASWEASKAMGSIDFNSATNGDFDLYPFHFANRYGYVADHSDHRAKLNGYLHLPLGFSVAISGWWSSELRWTPSSGQVEGMPFGVAFLEPRGSRKAGDRSQVDLQLGKDFRIGPTEMRVVGEFLNVFDTERPSVICGNVTGCGDAAMGDAMTWQRPRRYWLGLRLTY